MATHTLYRKCPECGKIRKYTVPYDHQYASGKEWQNVNGKLMCCWCFARLTSDGEQKLREDLAAIRKEKKDARKKVKALKLKGWWKGITQI